MSSDFMPLGIVLALLLFIGFIVPFIMGFFINVNDVHASGLGSYLSDLIDDGVSFTLPVVGEFSINPFSLLGNTLQNYLSDGFIYLGLLPDFLVVGLLIFSFVTIVYALLKLIP